MHSHQNNQQIDHMNKRYFPKLWAYCFSHGLIISLWKETTDSSASWFYNLILVILSSVIMIVMAHFINVYMIKNTEKNDLLLLIPLKHLIVGTVIANPIGIFFANLNNNIIYISLYVFLFSLIVVSRITWKFNPKHRSIDPVDP